MIVQSKENIFVRPIGCENATLGNIKLSKELAREVGCIRIFKSKNDKIISLINYNTSDIGVELDFIALDRWVSNSFNENEVLSVSVVFLPQENLIGDNSILIAPGDFRYNIDYELSEILNNLSDYYPYETPQALKKEVCYV